MIVVSKNMLRCGWNYNFVFWPAVIIFNKTTIFLFEKIKIINYDNNNLGLNAILVLLKYKLCNFDPLI